ncbi:MAG: AAA family ATPase [Xanthomonadales bacterium]|nr:AAA family ATPase [Xanthomonadales bacterium]
MLSTLAIAGYRSLRDLVVPTGRITVVTGANGSGKSNLYRALRLIAETARGGVVPALAREGGLQSVLWGGAENPSRGMRAGTAPIEGTTRHGPVALRLGFAGDDFGYSIDLGLPVPGNAGPTLFAHDPEVKREAIWSGPFLRAANTLVDRRGPLLRVREKRDWHVAAQHLDPFESLFTQVPPTAEITKLRETIRRWRFYDHFRADATAPARQAMPGSRTPVMHADGRDLAAAWRTIVEIGDAQALHAAVDDAFPGASVSIRVDAGRFTLLFDQHGLLRPLSAAELSDGTLRYLLWIAALLTPRPPPLIVLNEPETSLHPDLLPSLARLIRRAARSTQVWVVSHAPRLIAGLEEDEACIPVHLEKTLGETRVAGQGLLDAPAWHWPER